MIPSSPSKVCKDCGCEKSIEEFYKHSQMLDGHLNVCKDCKRTYQHERVLSGHTQRIDRKRYELDPERKQYIRMKSKEWRRLNPGKSKCHAALEKAILSKKIERGLCEICGEKAHAHHDDYSKPLEVRWLCAMHHSRLHCGMLTENELPPRRATAPLESTISPKKPLDHLSRRYSRARKCPKCGQKHSAKWSHPFCWACKADLAPV